MTPKGIDSVLPDATLSEENAGADVSQDGDKSPKSSGRSAETSELSDFVLEGRHHADIEHAANASFKIQDGMNLISAPNTLKPTTSTIHSGDTSTSSFRQALPPLPSTMDELNSTINTSNSPEASLISTGTPSRHNVSSISYILETSPGSNFSIGSASTSSPLTSDHGQDPYAQISYETNSYGLSQRQVFLLTTYIHKLAPSVGTLLQPSSLLTSLYSQTHVMMLDILLLRYLVSLLRNP